LCKQRLASRTRSHGRNCCLASTPSPCGPRLAVRCSNAVRP
jgi:hypothetical protein